MLTFSTLRLSLRRLTIVTLFLSFTSIDISAQSTSEILWDNYGVPHVYAKNEKEMYYAFGWAQMHNHANLLLQLYGQARGRASEYWGEEFASSDKLVLLFNLTDSARTHYRKYTGADKNNLDAFVQGINSYAKAHSDKIDAKVKQVLPVTVDDVLAHEARILCLQFLGANDIFNSRRLIAPGSNAYAIAPSKSTSKNALLLANPHLPWDDFFLFFEAHLSAPGFEAYGASLLGQPVLNIAFNNHLGWTHTVNTIDASDRYELTLQDSGYLLDGKIEKFEQKTLTINIRQKDGHLKQQNIELRYSKHGPVLGDKGRKAYAVRIAGLENAFRPVQWHRMAKAKNWKEFEAALKMLQNPMFNVVYADKAGNILYLFNGNVPKRPEGDWKFWNGTIDGRFSKYIWSNYHSYAELPKLFNPSTGFVQNANDAPWTCTFPMVLKPENYPPYMSPQEMPLRPQRAVNLIKDDASITFDELIAYKMNTGMEAADRFLDDLIAAVQQYPDSIALKAISVLKKWDKATNMDSRGAVLFANWFDRIGDDMLATVWEPSKPISTPNGLKHPKEAVEQLIKAVQQVEKMYGALDVAWGDVNRFKIGNYEFPANGGSGHYGIFRTIYFNRNNTNNKSYASAGDSYVAVVEFGSKVKAQVLLSYGNASQPGNKHVGDQLQLLSEGKLRPALLTRHEILQNLEEREILINAKNN
jgi:acyl-homoserine-lactone acylase